MPNLQIHAGSYAEQNRLWNITMAGNIEVDLLDTLENMKENLDEAGESVGSDILKSKININGKIINLLHINIRSVKKNLTLS